MVLKNHTKWFYYSAHDNESSINRIGQEEFTKIKNVVRKAVNLFTVLEGSSAMEDDLFLYRSVTNSGLLESFKRTTYEDQGLVEGEDVKMKISNFSEV